MASEGARKQSMDHPEAPRCIRCGYPVPDRPHGCKGPCPHCGFLYPLGDCTD